MDNIFNPKPTSYTGYMDHDETPDVIRVMTNPIEGKDCWIVDALNTSTGNYSEDVTGCHGKANAMNLAREFRKEHKWENARIVVEGRE